MTYVKAFEDAEFDRRRSAVRHRMEDGGFDLLVCQDPANMNWLTGFDGWSFYTPQAVLVHRDDEAPLWFGRAQDARSASITTNLPAANIVAFSESLVHHPTGHPFDELCELIRQRGWGHARIGVDFDAHYYTARAHRHLVAGLPDATVSDNRELVNWARLVKSNAELAYMREAGELSTRVMNQALGESRPPKAAEGRHRRRVPRPGQRPGRHVRGLHEPLPADPGRRSHQHAAPHLDRCTAAE